MNTVSEKGFVSQPFELLIDQKKIAQRTAELGRQISRDYEGKDLVLLGVLKGCVVFLSDLMREITLPLTIEFLSAASYRKGIRQENDIVLGGGVEVPLKGRHVLVVDGIVDSARTITTILNRVRKEEPASLEIVTLLDKPGSHRSKITVKYKGFSIGNEFVIGYGLDNTQLYRNLPFVGRLVDR